jgi:hypothetical protein
MSQQFADEQQREQAQGPDAIFSAGRPVEGMREAIPPDRPDANESPVETTDEQAEFQPVTEGEVVPGIGEMAGTPHLAGSAQAISHPEVFVGMSVVGSDGTLLGQVIAVHEHGVVVERQMQRDLVVPFEALLLLGDQGVLSIPADQADAAGWGASSVM